IRVGIRPALASPAESHGAVGDTVAAAGLSSVRKPVAARHGLPSCPTRRSSDLGTLLKGPGDTPSPVTVIRRDDLDRTGRATVAEDRKSTRLNSSHVKTSYAVFCLKKKILLHARGIWSTSPRTCDSMTACMVLPT